MRRHAQVLVGRAREAVPEGTFAVGAGLLVAALTAYVFVIISLNALDRDGRAAFGAFWGFIFVAGPGLFLPLEQEVGRALAHRRAQGLGGGPLVTRAGKLGALLTALLVVAALALAPTYVDGPFHGSWTLVAALAVGMVGFAVMHLSRGTLSGNGRFRPYGVMLAADGVVRLGGAVILAAAGVRDVGAYGLCLALAPFVAVAVALWNQRGLLAPGPAASYTELSESLGWLLLGSVFMQALGYAALLGVNFLKTEADRAAAAAFTSAFFVARIPILAFQAVQGTLLPKLANLAGAARHDDFRSGLRQLLVVVVVIAAGGALAAFTIGPPVGRVLFSEFTIGNIDLGLLAVGSGLFIIALTLAQALLALHGHRVAALAWVSGVGAFAVVAGLTSGLERRVELGFIAGAAAAGSVIAVALARQMRTATAGIGRLIEAIEREPIEL